MGFLNLKAQLRDLHSPNESECMKLVLGFLALIFPFLYKYSYVVNNQYEHLPIILAILNRSYLLNDWYVIVTRSFGPRTFFAYYMAGFGQLMSLPVAFFI